MRAQLGIGPNDPPPADPKKLASVQRAAADLFDAERKYGRAQEMFKGKLISQQQLDEAASRFQSTQAGYTVALQEVDRLKALLVSSEASENLAEKKLRDATIRAPFPGSIKTRDVHPGEYLRVQGPVMVLVRTDTLARPACRSRALGRLRERRRHRGFASRSVSRRNVSRPRLAHQSLRSRRIRAPSKPKPFSPTRTAA